MMMRSLISILININILTLTASSHLYKVIDTGFIRVSNGFTCLGSYIGAMYILVIFILHHRLESSSSAGFSMALGHLNKNSDYSHQPNYFSGLGLRIED